jgi:hypothetical protein
MFNIKTILIASILLIGTSASTAQSVVPGFKGKRLFVEGNFACLPFIVIGPTAENGGLNRFNPNSNIPLPTVFPISWRAGGNINYVTGRRTTLLLGFDHFQTAMISNAYSKSILPRNPITITDLDYHTLFSSLSVNAIKFGIETSTGTGMLAPIGAYTRWTAQYYTLNGAIVDKYTQYAFNQKNDAGHRALGLDNASTWDIGIGLEMGSRMMIAKNTLLKIGISSNLNFMAMFGKRILPPKQAVFINPTTEDNVLEYIKNNDIQTFNQEVFNTTARNRNFIHSLLMINVGAAYLIK